MATTSATGTEFSGEIPVAALGEGEEVTPGIGPWRLAGKRLRRNKVALFFGGLFLLVVLLCLLAPVYSSSIAHAGPNEGFPDSKFLIGGKQTYVLGPTGIPIGPTWHSRFLLGADLNGRDVAVRLLYGGRNSLEVGLVATLITMLLGTALGLIAGYLRGVTDGIIRFCLDVLWAFPAVLLGVALGVSIAVGGLGPIKGNSLLVPAFVIGIVYIPYVAKPVRGQVLGLREREFIDAARQQGLSNVRIMFSEILPNLSSTVVVFLPLILANAILLEAGLSYLGAGVQPPNPSWGTMIADGIQNSIPAAIHNVLVPGIMLVIAVMSINVFGDGVRDALDPRAKVRIAR
jgi:peptide/nickel transport system permease protein